MKTKVQVLRLFLIAIGLLTAFSAGYAFHQPEKEYVLEHENDIKVEEPGSHNGGGTTTAFPFFSKVKNAKMVLRKRILHPGSAIGYHLQNEQEIYYILSGNGELQMNGKIIPVTTGDAILTLPGSSHGLKPAGNSDLAVLIAYQNI